MGAASGAVASRCRGTGSGCTDALTVGIALHAVEAVVGLVVGSLGASCSRASDTRSRGMRPPRSALPLQSSR